MLNNLELESILNQLLNSTKINDYAPNGLQIEGKSAIRKIVTGVTASQALIDYAVSVNADAILVHHGYFWKNENPCIRGMKGRRIKTLLQCAVSTLIGYREFAATGRCSQLDSDVGNIATSDKRS